MRISEDHRKKIISVLIIFGSFSFVDIRAQNQEYWQQSVSYKIDVTLNDINHTIKGSLELEYINHSPDTLQFIYFHLWPNAYRNDQTALARQLAAEKSKRKLKEADRGYIDSLAFSSEDVPLELVIDKGNIDVVKVLLDKPLFPGAKKKLATPFFVKLPAYYSRFGRVGQKYMMCQWYPKPAVYDRNGWHPMPYLDQGEFYSEFGKFDVRITLPSTYIVGATGALQSQTELQKYRQTGAANYQARSTENKYSPGHPGMKTLNFFADSVHDFAWFADKDFIIQYDTLRLKSGKVVDVFSYHQSNGNRQWLNSIDFIKDATLKYSDWIGEYPYPTVAAVEGPMNESSGGMEYPMITLITSPDANLEGLDAVITHEIGHNWFYGILATNEREHPWMDEGINTYFQFIYEAEKYRYNSIFGTSVPGEMKSLPADEFRRRVFNALNTLPARKPIATNSTGFSNKEEYGIVVYVKTAIWMFVLESAIGKDQLIRGVQEYYQRWKFRHPYPEDFKNAIEVSAGRSVAEVFMLIEKEGNFN